MTDYQIAIKILVDIHEDDGKLEEMGEVTGTYSARQSRCEIANVVRYLMKKRDDEK
jgi:hypothetical protein